MKIAVLCGGRSSERDVSLSTGIQVARALRETGHDVVLVDACVDFPLDCRPEEVFKKALPIENTPSVQPRRASKVFLTCIGFFRQKRS